MTINTDSFPNLMSPITINGLTLKNRIVSTGHGTRLANKHIVSESLMAYHEARAKGGVGLIVTEAAMIDAESVVSPMHLAAFSDDIIPSFRQLANTLHQYDCALIGQLFHLGLEQPTRENGCRAVAYGPSASSSERYHTAGRELSLAKLTEIIRMFGASARRMRDAGMDGVEFSASHGYLPAQFLAPSINRRTDEYGGSFENRMRFVLESLENIRENIGPDKVLGFRISGDELASDGLEAEEVLEVCAAISRHGAADYFNICSGSSRQRGAAINIVPPMSTDMGLTVPYAAAIKKLVSQPVMAVGRINYAPAAEAVISSGQADMCGMTRALITDPEMPIKVAQGRLDDVQVCIGCNQSCIDRMHRGYGISCIQRPETGRELTYGDVQKTAVPKRVFVVGGGPGGMNAAASAAERGHDVTLFEASSQLGGQVKIAQLLPRRSEFGGLIQNLEKKMVRHGVNIKLGQHIDQAFIERENPDVVIIATGGRVKPIDLEGAEEANVVTAWDVLQGTAKVGARVVVADWRCDWIGLGIAEKLALEGSHVRLASTGYIAGENIPRYMRDLWLGELHKLGVVLIPMVRLFGVDDDTVYFQNITSNEAVLCEDVDTLVVSQGHDACDSLLKDLENWQGKVLALGDCLAPRTAEEAILEGLESVCLIDD